MIRDKGFIAVRVVCAIDAHQNKLSWTGLLRKRIFGNLDWLGVRAKVWLPTFLDIKVLEIEVVLI